MADENSEKERSGRSYWGESDPDIKDEIKRADTSKRKPEPGEFRKS